MKKVLFFGAPVFQIPVIEKAKQMGLYVGVVDINPEAKAIKYADEYFCESLRDNERLLTTAEKFKPDGIVIGACDTSVVSASWVCKQLGLPGHSMETAIKATNKLEMLKAFQKHNVAHPQFQLVNRDEIDTFEMGIPYPAISKPIDASGSRGICYIDDETILPMALKYSCEASRTGTILVEEYMSGPEVSVEVLVVNGVPHVLQITDKITSGPPYFFEVGHSQPSSISISTKEAICRLAEQACIAIGLVNSPAHVEIKVTKDGPKMVELGARLGGDCIATYLLDASIKGICLSEETIKIALGEEPKLGFYSNSGSAVAVRFIVAQEGTIRSVSGINEAKKMEGVINVSFFGEQNRHYKRTADNASRIGFVVARADTTTTALKICERAIDTINIDYKKN